MTTYKRQHTVPVSYQRSFSTDRAKRNRSSKVYKFSKADACWTGPVRAEKQCWASDFYSAADREKSEKELQVIEDDYAKWSEKVYQQGFASLTEEEVYNLALTVLALFARNPVHRHTGVLPEERNRVAARYEAVSVLVAAEYAEAIKEGVSEEIRRERQDEIQRRWSLHEVRAAAGSSFIYTDSPVVPCFIGTTGARTLAFIMPFDAEAVWIYADEGVHVGATTATEDDVDKINSSWPPTRST